MRHAELMLRRLALRVAGISEADRSWLYVQLLRDERQRLQALVAEVVALGLHRAAGSLADLDIEEPLPPEPATVDAHAHLPEFWRDVLQGLETADEGAAPTRAATLRRSLLDWAERSRPSTDVGAIA
jgi:hypothetical protein